MSILYHYLIVFFISMVPLIELRGAIPYAIGFIESGVPLSLPLCYLIAIVGNMLPVPVIYWFARKVLEWGKEKKVIGIVFTVEKGYGYCTGVPSIETHILFYQTRCFICLCFTHSVRSIGFCPYWRSVIHRFLYQQSQAGRNWWK